jgi:RNA polymerase sigma-70 factor (ECF subfamily)
MRDIVIDLENALSELPPDLRNTLILHRRQGFTYQEIAEICGISKKTVEKQIGIALKKLRKLLNY